MKFTEVKEIPEYSRRYRGVMRDRLEEFMNMNIKAVKVEDHGYKTPEIAYKALHKATKRWALPIDVVTRKGEIFLIRRDI